MMNWEIHSYGGGDWLRMIFTAMASLFNNGDYMMAGKVVCLCTFIGIMVKIAFSKDGAHNFRYIMAVIFFLYVSLLPRATVIITDSINPANSAVVANVPLGVAAVAGMASAFSWWATGAMEAVLSNPSDKPTQTGFLFYDSMMKQINKVTIVNSITAQNYRQFFESCVVVDGVGHNRFTWGDMLNAPDLDAFYKQQMTNVAGFFYTGADGKPAGFQYCKDGYSNVLSKDITNDVPQAIQSIAIPWSAEYGSLTNAANMVNSQLAGTVKALTSAGGTSSSITRQYMLTNSLDTAMGAMAGELNDQNAQSYIVNKANVERSLTFTAVGQIAADKMPLLRTILEGIIYALAPLVFLFAIVNPWQVTVAYAKAVLWISLWAPMYAVLHFAGAYFDSQNLQRVAQFYGGLSPNAISSINYYMSEGSNIAGYLMGGLPVICWLIISNSGAMLASFAGRVTDGFEKSVGQSADEVTRGAGAAGGKQWQATQTAEATSGAMASQVSHGGAMVSHFNSDGDKVTQDPSGRTVVEQQKSNLVANRSAAQSFAETKSAAAQQAESVAKSSTAQVAESTTALLSSTQAAAHQVMSGLSNSSSDKATVGNAYETANTRTESSLNEYAKTHGYSEGAAAAARASLGLSAVGSGVGASGGTTAERKEGEALKNAFVQSDVGSQSVKQSAQTMQEALKTVQGSVADQASHGLSSALNKQEQAMEQHSVAEQQSFTAHRDEQMAKQHVESLATDSNDVMLNYAVQHLGYTADTYSAMVRGVSAQDSEAMKHYGAVMEATNNAMPSGDAISKQYKTDSEAIQRLGAADMKEIKQDGQSKVQGAHSSFDAQESGQVRVGDGAASNDYVDKMQPIAAPNANFGQANVALRSMNPANESLTDGVDRQTSKAVDGGAETVGKTVVRNAVGAVIGGAQAIHAVGDFAREHNPFEGVSKK
jgi:conjugal transfer mating pair stabilization protein TraG